MRLTNTGLILAACVVYVVLTFIGGRTSINGGLGPDGSVYEAMAVNHDLQSGSAVDKLAPAFPLAAAIVYSVTRNVILGFFIFNMVAFGVLVWAPARISNMHA